MIRLGWTQMNRCKRWIFMVSGRSISIGPAAYNEPLHYRQGERVQTKNNSSTDDIDIIRPATGELLSRTRGSNSEDVNLAVKGAGEGLSKWSLLSGMGRAKVMHKAADIIRKNAEDLSRAEVMDTGKPIWEARFDIESCADTIEYFAGLAPAMNGEHIPLSDGNFAFTRREPLGICGGIGAWNYPFQMAVFKSAPALACGNAMVFKPSPLTPITAVMLAEIYTEAGLPDGCFNVVQGEAETGELLSHHPDIAKMSFTGSVATGSKVMQACAKGIKYVTLELGGKSPVVIFDDCDLENAVRGAMMANFTNQGQVCSNGTRVFVQRSIFSNFLERLVSRTKQMKIGDPMLEDTHVGATISGDHAQKVMGYVNTAIKEGAEVLCGGGRVILDNELKGGHYLSPCVLTNLNDEMTVVKEEIFGSVASVLLFDSEEEVVERANNTELGLAAGVFTKDIKRAHRVAADLQAGALYVNNYNIFPCEIPFGGYKKSGIGRENGHAAMEYYSQLKSVYIEMNDVWCPY